MFEYIILLVTLLFPYTILGEETASVIAAFIGFTYLITKKDIIIHKNKKIILMTAVAAVSLIILMLSHNKQSGLWNIFLI